MRAAHPEKTTTAVVKIPKKINTPVAIIPEIRASLIGFLGGFSEDMGMGHLCVTYALIIALLPRKARAHWSRIATRAYCMSCASHHYMSKGHAICDVVSLRISCRRVWFVGPRQTRATVKIAK